MQPIPDVRNFLTSGSTCVKAFKTTAERKSKRRGEGTEVNSVSKWPTLKKC